MTAQNLLVELFVEELPPKALKQLGDAFGQSIFENLQVNEFLSPESALTIFASPRRLAAHITDVRSVSGPKSIEHRLMPASIGIDANGAATHALIKKLKSQAGYGDGTDFDAIFKSRVVTRSDGKTDVLWHVALAAGSLLANRLERVIDTAIRDLPIPKLMTYQLGAGSAQRGWTSVSFVRPAHGLVAMHGSEVLMSIKALGLTAGNATHGHRFEASVDPVVLKHADTYAQQLRDEGAVIASFDERRAEIVRQLQAAATRIGGGVRPIDDDALLDEVTALVERPNVLVCEFEREYLDVPQECLILTMKANQKYFPLLAADGKLTNQFLVVSNITPDNPSAVIGGNERVVRPRLADAKFFFDQDRKKTLESRVESLDKVVYHNKLGTQGERMERVRAIARAIAEKMGDATLVQQADQAARLAKTDLVTDMVGEFPELQGTMGRYYALNDGLAPAVADAIEDHYKPRFAGDTLPRGDVGIVVALADKLETLVGMFGIGNLPTGDRDPFALRRHALGIARMLVERVLPLHFHELTRLAFAVFPGGVLQDKVVELDEFLIERLKGNLRDGGYSAPEVDAALHARQMTEWSSIPRRLEAVRAFASLPEAPALAAANKRISNILKKSEGTEANASVDPALLQEPAERDLHAALQSIATTADAQFTAGDYAASLQSLAALRAPVDAFFDGVMVNAEDPALRANRLALLGQLHNAMNRVADLSRLAA